MIRETRRAGRGGTCYTHAKSMRLFGAGWRLALGLLIAVSTALLFSAAAHPPAMERGAGDEQCTAGQHDVPVVLRPQDSPDRSARRDDTDPCEPHFHELAVVEAHAFAAWPLPAPKTSPPTHIAGGWYARGPPAGMS